MCACSEEEGMGSVDVSLLMGGKGMGGTGRGGGEEEVVGPMRGNSKIKNHLARALQCTLHAGRWQNNTS